MEQEIKFEFRIGLTNRKSMDRLLRKLINYINNVVNNNADWTEKERVEWAQKTFKSGITNMAKETYLNRVDSSVGKFRK